MEITDKQWEELINKVDGFAAKIEEIGNENDLLKSKNEEYELKLKEWKQKLDDQQKTIDTLNKTSQNNNKTGGETKTHKSVRFDPIQDKLIFED